MGENLANLFRFLRRWWPVAGWAVVIMVVTTDLGSLPNSQRLLNPVFLWFNPKMKPHQLYMANVQVRKACHVMEFAVLAILIWRARKLLRKPWLGHGPLGTVIAVLGPCAFFALGTELIQSVSRKRSGSPQDVLINLSGAVLGIGLVFMVGAVRAALRRWRSLETGPDASPSPKDDRESPETADPPQNPPSGKIPS